MRSAVLFVMGLAILFLASAVQTFGTNWLGQTCPYPGPSGLSGSRSVSRSLRLLISLGSSIAAVAKCGAQR